jgi:hypothetical protein
VDPAVTFALALVGTITGVATAAVEIARTARDRARVQILMTSHSSITQPKAWVSVEVLNTGRQPLTIREVGIYPGTVRVRHKRQEDGVERDGRSDVLLILATEPFVLEAGTLATFQGHLDEFFNVGLHADRLLRPFAVDLARRWHWGDVEPLMRSFINHGYQVPPGTPDRLLDSGVDPGPVPSKPRRGLRGSQKGERLIVRFDSSLSPPN